MDYRHIVFDVDGTLVDSESCILHAFRDALERQSGKKYPLEELTFCLGITGADAVKRFPELDGDRLLEEWTAGLETYAHTAGIFPGIPELLTTLKNRGCQLGVATSRTHAEFDKDLERSGLGALFGQVICADDSETHKPQPGPLLKYMELTGAKREEILYVGDSLYDSLCAQGAGVDFALAVWGSHTKDRPAKYYPVRPDQLLEYGKQE